MGFDLAMLQDPKFQDVPRDMRLSGAGIDGLSAAMYAAGVLDTESDIPDDFVGVWPPPGMDKARAATLFDYINDGNDPAKHEPPLGPDDLAACHAWLAASDARASTRSPQAGKVPAYKFGSTQNWWVVPEECALIADAMDKLLEDLPEGLAKEMEWDGNEDALIEWLEDWRDYNRVAASHGGYRVG